MRKLRISVARIHQIALVLSLVLACFVTAISGTIVFSAVSAQTQTRQTGERIARLEERAQTLADADKRVLDEIAAAKAEQAAVEIRVRALESTVGGWKTAVVIIGGLITLLQGILLLTRGRIRYEGPAAEDEHPRRRTGSG